MDKSSLIPYYNIQSELKFNLYIGKLMYNLYIGELSIIYTMDLTN